MSLDPWDMAELDALADASVHMGRAEARHVYRDFSLPRGWHGTPKWRDGRIRFKARYRAGRGRYLDLMAQMDGGPSEGFLGAFMAREEAA